MLLTFSPGEWVWGGLTFLVCGLIIYVYGF